MEATYLHTRDSSQLYTVHQPSRRVPRDRPYSDSHNDMTKTVEHQRPK